MTPSAASPATTATKSWGKTRASSSPVVTKRNSTRRCGTICKKKAAGPVKSGTGARTATSTPSCLPSAPCVMPQGKAQRYVALFSDITALKNVRTAARTHRPLRRADQSAQPRAAGRPPAPGHSPGQAAWEPPGSGLSRSRRLQGYQR